MSLLDDINRDREAGTPGPWVPKTIHTGAIYGDGKYVACCWTTPPREDTWRPDTSRIARVPDMEAALLAAEDLAKRADAAFDWLEIMEGRGNSAVSVNLRSALAAYRAATGDA